EVEQQRHLLESAVGQVAPKDKWKLCLAVPEIESIFFSDAGFVQQLFQTEISESDSLKARAKPKEIVKKLFQERHVPYTPDGIDQFLRDKELTPLRNTALIRDIRESLESVTQDAA